MFVLIEWLIPDEEKSLVDLETQTKFILDRKREELRENQLIAAQEELQRKNSRDTACNDGQNDGSKTNRSTVTRSSTNSYRIIPGHGSESIRWTGKL